MKSKRRKDATIFGSLLLICLFFYLTGNFWRQQLRVYINGRVAVAAEDYGVALPLDIDAVEIFTFADDSNGTDTNGFVGDYQTGDISLFQDFIDSIFKFSLTFPNAPFWRQPIMPAQIKLKTAGHKILTGNDAKEVVDLWRSLAVGHDYQAMCFEPIYGLKFKRDDKVYFQTSICWHCAGYTLPVPPLGTFQYGFNASGETAQKLLKTLEQHLPLPPTPIKSQSKLPSAATATNSTAH